MGGLHASGRAAARFQFSSKSSLTHSCPLILSIDAKSSIRNATLRQKMLAFQPLELPPQPFDAIPY